jgi:hypothetical protein
MRPWKYVTRWTNKYSNNPGNHPGLFYLRFIRHYRNTFIYPKQEYQPEILHTAWHNEKNTSSAQVNNSTAGVYSVPLILAEIKTIHRFWGRIIFSNIHKLGATAGVTNL